MDIVERLRTVVSIGTGTVTPLRLEAADEIERLREALKKIAARDLQSIARSALNTRDPEIQFHLLNELAQYDMQAIAIDALAPGARVPPAWVSD